MGRKLRGGHLNVVFAGLGGEETFGLVPMALAFAVFFVGVLNVDFFVHEVLLVHGFDGFVGGFKGVVGYEAEALGDASVITSNLKVVNE